MTLADRIERLLSMSLRGDAEHRTRSSRGGEHGFRVRRVSRRPGMTALIYVSLTLLLTSFQPARAHDSRPLFIELTELPDGALSVRSTAPGAIDPENAPRVALGAPCAERRREAGDPLRQRALYQCAVDSASLTIDWPVYNPSISTLIRVVYRNGETRTAVLDPSADEWRVPPADSFEGVAKSYFKIGVGHIISGVDHLLFLAGLLIIAGTARRTLITVSGFTAAHSATLALVALGVVRISTLATEAVIALSIVFLATEIARGDRTTLAWRRPTLVASAFGLAHGAGFASALGEIGLPKVETIAALLFFNVGVEAGQLAIIAAAFAVMFSMRKISLSLGRGQRAERAGEGSDPGLKALSPHPKPLRGFDLSQGRGGSLLRSAGYALGVVSTYWFIERIAALFA